MNVTPLGFKPKTFRTGICCSIQLSYGAQYKDAVASPYINTIAKIRNLFETAKYLQAFMYGKAWFYAK